LPRFRNGNTDWSLMSLQNTRFCLLERMTPALAAFRHAASSLSSNETRAVRAQARATCSNTRRFCSTTCCRRQCVHPIWAKNCHAEFRTKAGEKPEGCFWTVPLTQIIPLTQTTYFYENRSIMAQKRSRPKASDQQPQIPASQEAGATDGASLVAIKRDLDGLQQLQQFQTTLITQIRRNRETLHHPKSS